MGASPARPSPLLGAGSAWRRKHQSRHTAERQMAASRPEQSWVLALASSQLAPQHLQRTCPNVHSSNAECIPTTLAATCANPELGGSLQGDGMTHANAVAPTKESFDKVAVRKY